MCFKYIGKETFPSSNQLSLEANVSKASLSRFIKKYGFENYQQFRSLLSTQTTLLGYNLKVFLSQNILLKKIKKSVIIFLNNVWIIY